MARARMAKARAQSLRLRCRCTQPEQGPSTAHQLKVRL